MNLQQKEAIKQHQLQMMNEIIPTEKLFAALYQNGIFDENMIEMIKAEKTDTDQVSKMLNMLPKRGPEAFDRFIMAIKNDYPWMSQMLICSANQTQANPASGNTKPSMKTEAEVTSKRQMSAEQPTDLDFKTKVGMFVHKQFGQSRRIHQDDIKAMEKFLADQIKLEQKCIGPHYCDCASDISTMDKASSLEPLEVLQAEFQNQLKEMHKKCEPHLNQAKNEVNNNVPDKISLCDIPTDVTLAVIETDLDFVLEKLAKLECQISEIHELLGDPEKKCLTTNLVNKIKKQCQQYEKELNQEKEKNENFLTDMYNYSKHINKLELLKQQMKTKLDAKENEVEKLRQENVNLQKKYESLHQINMQHAEKTNRDIQEIKLNGQNTNYQKAGLTVPRTKKTSRTGATRQISRVISKRR
ncbi:hypothetical protein ACJMK2_002173 [Sinanodonta woodiana]|uniref:CARD domain-containing protein n=1 Tax=Sinanodonta woodiana TaxID=1069815 RepID=A0ABD3XWA4_SINWO